MNISYIYDKKGEPEYAVIPIIFWKKLEKDILKTVEKNNISKKFNPKEYKGIISSLNLNIEDEIQEMREEWERSIL
ncbi:MAG TPA: hypothetical protein PKY56_00880 [Candidatus Kapabacteria bacterium]|nr:hypothetical protein [Candidatus Kapabacteria bacterium]HPO63336.1 hypothetical protein [Candidatus Kapabacteria bacterium]